MDTTDLTNRIQEEQEQFELDEQIRATEEDRGFDRPTIINNEEPAPEETKLTDEQLYNFRQQNIKTIYATLYSLGLDGKTETVRKKLDLLSQFFGNIGGVSNISDEELAVIGHMLDELKVRNYKFSR